MSNPADSPFPMVIPAKAGIHWGSCTIAEMWVPAGVYPRAGRRPDPWAGTTIGADFDNRLYVIQIESLIYGSRSISI